MSLQKKTRNLKRKSKANEKFILSIDQGTTSSRALIINKKGEIIAKAQTPFQQIFPQPGWVEHSPQEIWNTVQSTISEALKKARIKGQQIAAIGITNQRETIVGWNKQTNQSVYNAIVWQCRRTEKFCQQVLSPQQTSILKKTGLVVDPYFSGSKIHWLIKNIKGVREKALRGDVIFGTIDSFLIWNLSGGQAHKTDVSNASRTQLMNIHTGQWDPDLLKLFRIPKHCLPEITYSSGAIALTKGLKVLPDGIPITGVAGDQQAALFGQQGFSAGNIKVTFGTGSFLLLNTGTLPLTSRHRLLTTVAWQIQNKKIVYALEGSVFICGAAVQWLRDGVHFIKKSDEIKSLAESVKNSGGVEFVPALTGLGAPHWNANARGLITGLTRDTTMAHIARATLEAMALQNVDVILAMEKDLGKKIKSLRVDGGAVANDLLMQIQADYLGASVQRPFNIESTALGAAYLAGVGIGFWKTENEIKKLWKLQKEFKGQLTLNERKARLIKWHTAIKRCLLETE